MAIQIEPPRQQSIRANVPSTHCRSSRPRVMSMDTKSGDSANAVGSGQVFAFGEVSTLTSLPTTPTSTTSNSSCLVQFTAHQRWTTTQSVSLLDKPCRICLSREPDHCKLLSPETRAALLAAQEANYTLQREEGYCSSRQGSRSGPSNLETARSNMGLRQATAEQPTRGNDCSERPGQPLNLIQTQIAPLPENYPESA